MNMYPYDAVVFDLDGTLFEAEEGIVSSVRYTLNKLNCPVAENEDLSWVVGPPLRESFLKLGVPSGSVEEAMSLYRADFRGRGMYLYSVYPGIRKLLGMLRQGGVYTAVATSKPLKLAEEILRYFGLIQAFDKVVGEQDGAVKMGKPELIRTALPDHYRRAAMVGDRCFDAEGAKAAGVDAIGVLYGCGTEEELRAASADAIVATTDELCSLLCPDGKPPRGFFLTVEGPDGSGKTTQVNLLEKSLRQFGFDVLRTREPGGCPISEEIRRVVLSTAHMEMCDTCEALLYAASRAQHVHQVIRPAVEEGRLVLCDRFVDSSVAYQGGGRELGVETIQQINAPAVAGMMPDATLYLAIDHRQALKRRLAASSPDRLESQAVEFHGRVQRAYEQLIEASPERFVVVNADQPVEDVARDALIGVLGAVIG